MPGAAEAPVAAYNYGAFLTAPPVIGVMQPLPAAPAPARFASKSGGLAAGTQSRPAELRTSCLASARSGLDSAGVELLLRLLGA